MNMKKMPKYGRTLKERKAALKRFFALAQPIGVKGPLDRASLYSGY